MGNFLENAEDAGPFIIEVSRDSFSVSTAPDVLVLSAKRNVDGTARLGIPANALNPFIAAVSQVMAHPVARDAKSTEENPWGGITRHEGDFVIGGTAVLFRTVEGERRPVRAVEFSYGDAYRLVRIFELVRG